MSAFTIAGLQDLFRHLEWAESRVWSTALASPAAIADVELRERLHHIHLTQRVFLELWTAQPIGRYQALAFPSLREVYRWARPYYPAVHAYLGGVSGARLDDPTPVPWARYFAEGREGPAGATTLGETLFQVTAHSAYHRAQVNARLRALAVTPPLVDYIAWIWVGRPQPSWPGEGA